MSDPRRIKDLASEGSAELRELLGAARTDLPDAARLEGILGRIDGAGGAGGAGSTGDLGGSGDRGGSPGAGAPRSGVVLKAGATVLVLGALAGLFAHAHAGTQATSDVRVAKDVDPPSAPLPEPPVPAPTGVPGPVLAPPPDAAEPASPPSAPSHASRSRPSLARPLGDPPARGPTEIELLDAAQDALRSNPAKALATADEDALRFPTGSLAQEREVIAIEALVRLHRVGDARVRAARFFKDYPSTAHRPRIESILATDGSTSTGEAGAHPE